MTRVKKLEISRENIGLQAFNSNFLLKGFGTIWYHCGVATNLVTFYHCAAMVLPSLLQPLCRSKEVEELSSFESHKRPIQRWPQDGPIWGRIWSVSWSLCGKRLLYKGTFNNYLDEKRG